MATTSQGDEVCDSQPRRALAVLVLACGLAVVLVGCVEARPAPYAVTPAVKVGTGKDGFVPLSDGDPVEIQCDPEGGTHIWGAARVTGFDDATETFYFHLFDGSTEVGNTVRPAGAGPTNEISGQTIFLAPNVAFDPASLVGKTLTLALRVDDALGAQATDQVPVVVAGFSAECSCRYGCTAPPMGPPCLEDCQCTLGSICVQGFCQESGVVPSGICPSDCACNGGECITGAANPRGCCYLPDGRIARKPDAACQF